MATPPQPIPPQSTQQEVARQKFEWTCGVCTNKQLELEPMVILVNHRAMSTLTMVHENAIICRQCGRNYIPVMLRVQFNLYGWQFIEVPDEKKSEILITDALGKFKH